MPKTSSSAVKAPEAPTIYVDSNLKKPGTRNPRSDRDADTAGLKKAKGLSARPPRKDPISALHHQQLSKIVLSKTEQQSGESGISTKKLPVPFTVYCDDDTEMGEESENHFHVSHSASTSSSPHSPPGKIRRLSSASSSGQNKISTMETSSDERDGTDSEVMSMLSNVPLSLHVGSRKPLGELPADPWKPPSVDDVVGSPGDLRDEGTADGDMSFLEDEEEGGESTYESVASWSRCGYHRAIQPSERELHTDKIYCAPAYFRDIYLYLKERETMEELRPTAGYMEDQRDLNNSMRCMLVDWLVDVALEYELGEESLHLAVSLLDRFLSVFPGVLKEELQLVGTTAMMIAAKFEVIDVPDLGEFVYITDDTYSRKEVMDMERLILKTLDFQVDTPNALTFAFEYLKICRADARAKSMTMYVLDLSLLNMEIMKWLPSVMAAAAVCLANVITGAEPWPFVLESWTEMRVKDIFECLRDLLGLLRHSSELKQHSVVDKYKDTGKYCGVALLEHPKLSEILE